MNDESYSKDRIAYELYRYVSQGVSDIHFECLPATSSVDFKVNVRLRINGGLGEPYEEMPLKLYEGLVAYLKDISGLGSADNKKPLYAIVHADQLGIQGARFGCCFIPRRDNKTDLVISVLTSQQPPQFESLGWRTFELNALRDAVYGIVLFSGPVGSARLTTRSAYLCDVGRECKVWSIEENPVYPDLTHVCRIEASPESGNSYEDWMRILTTQMDPDFIHIGSLKGPGKLPLAVDAALNGVVVTADMIANNACDAIMRYLDWGREVYARTLVDALAMVVSQRVLKMLCQHCRVPVRLDQDQAKRLVAAYHAYPEDSENQLDADSAKATYTRWLKEYGDKDRVLYRYQAKGCSECGNEGYRGRLPISEVIVVSPKVRELLLSHPTEEAILKTAMQQGTSTMRQDAIEKALGGVFELEQIGIF